MMTREGGAQPKEYLAKYAADRVRTVAMTWLGSTMACCECHDHKFDPFTAKDFYSLSAFWADVKQWGVYTTYNYTPNPDLAGFTNDHPFPPEIIVDSPYLQQRIHKLSPQIDHAAQAAFPAQPEARERFDQWRASTQSFLKENPTGWFVLSPAHPTTSPATAPNDGSIPLAGKPGADERLELPLKGESIAAIRLEALPHVQNGSIIRGNAPGADVHLTASLRKKSGGETKLPIYQADADQKDDQYANGYALIGIKSVWKTSSQNPKSAQTAVYILESPAKPADNDALIITLPKNTLARVRISISPVTALTPIDPQFIPTLTKSLDAQPANGFLQRTYLLSTASNAEALASARRIIDEILECRAGKSPVMVTQAWEPKITRVLPRGNWQNETGELVTPAPPHFLPQPPIADARRLTRLDLAKWLVSPDNPLTARTIVNRMWKQFFGNGISNTVEDLGSQGEWPSHPDLLDWLAVEFHESGWDIKHMVRLMVTASVYKQDSSLRPELREIDPANRLLSSQNPRRLEAEFVRDNALAIAGLLNSDLGGPSAKPYQPEGYYANIQFPSRKYVPEIDDRQYRRGLYMHWQRTFLHPMLANFDAPSREDSICTRNVSNTPQQALTLLNDPTFVEAARALAARALQSSSDDAARFNFIYSCALCRQPKPNEIESLKSFLAQQRNYYKSNPDDAFKLIHVGLAPLSKDLNEPELAAWTSACRVVLNLHETLTRY